MSRLARLEAIRRLVARQHVPNQAVLVELLAKQGVDVTQTTVSRDVRKLGLIKIAGADGATRYAAPEHVAESPAAPQSLESLRSLFQRSVVSVDQGAALIVLRTPAGFANAVAASLDALERRELVGTIAGDDTVLLILRRAADRARILQELSELLD